MNERQLEEKTKTSSKDKTKDIDKYIKRKKT